MLFVETGREPEIGQLDVTRRVDENVVGLDIAAGQTIRDCWDRTYR